MTFPENKRFKFLIFLHNCGILSLPNYYEAEWKNWMHRNCYRNAVFLLQILFSVCQAILTFRYAVHELSQFLQKFMEGCVFYLVIPSEIILSSKVDSIIALLHKMDTEFSSANREIFNKQCRREKFLVRFYVVLFFIINSVILADALLPSAETVELMARLYHRTEPIRLFPTMICVPFIDTNQLTTFITIYILEIYLLTLNTIGIAEFLFMEFLFTLPVACQFELLSTYVKLLGAEHRNKEGSLIRYTDVVDGGYRLVDAQKQDRSINENSPNSMYIRNRIKYLETIEYEVAFMRMILLRQQELTSFLNLYYFAFTDVINSITFCVIGLVMISVYQVFIISTVSLVTQVKVFVEFVSMIITAFNLLDESERVNSSFVSLAQSLCASHWYCLRSNDTKRSACLMLRICQRGKYTVHMGGLIRQNRTLFVRIMHRAYTFANFMKLSS